MKPAVILARLQAAIEAHNRGDLDAAETIYRAVLASAPRHADALHLLALVRYARNDFVEAARLADAASSVAPQVANFCNTAGQAYSRGGRPETARQRFEQATRLDPRLALAHYNLSLVLRARREAEAALAAVTRALALRADYAEALALRLDLEVESGAWPEAFMTAAVLAASDAANHRLSPERLRYHVQHAQALIAGRQYAAAGDEAERALQLDPRTPAAWVNLGVARHAAGDLPGAEEAYRRCLMLDPEERNAVLNLSSLCVECGRVEEAESRLSAWLARHPADAEARFGRAGARLVRGGDWAAGWADYEARWQVGTAGSRQLGRWPEWRGPLAEPLAGRTLLLYAEQGFGDTLQMLRYVPELVAHAARVVLLVPAPLVALARRIADTAKFAATASLTDDMRFDYECPLMSLPGRCATNEPALIPPAPYLSADPVGEQRFARDSRDALAASRCRVGLVWRGSDLGPANSRRRLGLDTLAPLGRIEDVDFVSLQYGDPAAAVGDAAMLALNDHVRDFADTAALIAGLDLVVALDSAVAHLAGALGKPVWILLPFLHDWRWGLAAETTPWYPTARLYRQSDPLSWDEVVRRVADDLAALARSSATIRTA